MADEELVKKFVELHSQTEQLLNEEKLKEAKQKYLQVVDTYHAIEKSSLEKFHKELAYDQVTRLFKKVNETRERVNVPWHLIAAGSLIIAFSILIFLNPSIVGLAGLDNTLRDKIDITFTESKIHQATLKDRPLSLSATGEFTGNVKLFFKKGDKLETVFDSQKSPSTGGKFTDVCEETCEISAQSNTIELFAQVEEGSRLHITELSYAVQRKSNTPPVWTGNTRTFKAEKDKTTTIDLSQYFKDDENDPLTFLSTAAQGLDVTVEHSKVSLTPSTTGDKNIVFIASDLRDVTRVAVTIEVK
jgi:hypothetical protein